MKISRRRKNKLELQLTYIAISNPLAVGEYRHKVVLEALPRNGVLTPEQLKNQPVSLTIVCNGEGSRVAEDIDIADSPLEDAEQIWGRHHRVCDNIEAPRFHSARIRQANCRVARARRSKLPQAADPLGGKACIGIAQRRPFELCLLKQRWYIEPGCLERLGDALDPKSRTSRLTSTRFVHRPHPLRRSRACDANGRRGHQIGRLGH